MLGLAGCEGCNYVLMHALLHVGVEPGYFPQMVEHTEPPGRVDLLVVTGACTEERHEELLRGWTARASRILLVGCCALNCGVLHRIDRCKPPALIVQRLGLRRVYKVPGCPPHQTILEAMLLAALRGGPARLLPLAVRGAR